jgi:hypothetical protein
MLMLVISRCYKLRTQFATLLYYLDKPCVSDTLPRIADVLRRFVFLISNFWGTTPASIQFHAKRPSFRLPEEPKVT